MCTMSDSAGLKAHYQSLEERAKAYDKNDALASFRHEFSQPKSKQDCKTLYAAGNSLGLMPKKTSSALQSSLEKWRDEAVEGHFTSPNAFVDYADTLRSQTATLLGSQENEVVLMNSLTVNLHLLLCHFYKPSGEKRQILIEPHAFPSDIYAVQSQIKQHGGKTSDYVTLPVDENGLIDEAQFATYLAENHHKIALILLPGVQYYTGEALDLTHLCQLAKQYDILVGADLAHAIGNVPLNLHKDNIDFAVFCTYKYLNAGPGAIGGAFIHQTHLDTLNNNPPALQGWWGEPMAVRFQMDDEFTTYQDARAFQLSNPSILSLIPLAVSLEIFEAASIERCTQKTAELTPFFAECLEQINRAPSTLYQVKLLTPVEKNTRQKARFGAQISLELIKKTSAKHTSEPRLIFEKLTQHGVLGDWREPNVIRLSLPPLYSQFNDAVLIAMQLHRCLL